VFALIGNDRTEPFNRVRVKRMIKPDKISHALILGEDFVIAIPQIPGASFLSFSDLVFGSEALHRWYNRRKRKERNVGTGAAFEESEQDIHHWALTVVSIALIGKNKSRFCGLRM
jgi:hypothetical protein